MAPKIKVQMFFLRSFLLVFFGQVRGSLDKNGAWCALIWEKCPQNEMKCSGFSFGGHFLEFFSGLGIFGHKSFALPKICLLLRLCWSGIVTEHKHSLAISMTSSPPPVFFAETFQSFVRNRKNFLSFFRFRTFLYDWKRHYDRVDLIFSVIKKKFGEWPKIHRKRNPSAHTLGKCVSFFKGIVVCSCIMLWDFLYDLQFGQPMYVWTMISLLFECFDIL